MKWIEPIVLIAAVILNNGCMKQKEEMTMTNLYDIEVETITGETTNLADYRGKVLLIVNTASKCGFTGQYDGLQQLYGQYNDQGLVVLGFPSNDFLGQEPGTEEEIMSFCRINYGVSFPMFAKVAVKGSQQHPLYRYLTDKTTNPQHSGKITWNFNKFLIGRDGTILARFGSRTQPKDAKLISAVEQALEKTS